MIIPKDVRLHSFKLAFVVAYKQVSIGIAFMLVPLVKEAQQPYIEAKPPSVEAEK